MDQRSCQFLKINMHTPFRVVDTCCTLIALFNAPSPAHFFLSISISQPTQRTALYKLDVGTSQAWINSRWTSPQCLRGTVMSC